MSFRSRLVLVVKANRAVGAEIVCVSRFGGKSAFDAVDSAAGGHFPVAVQEEIDLFGCLMMMGKICPTGSEIHPEKAGHDVGLVQGVPFRVPWPNQEFV